MIQLPYVKDGKQTGTLYIESQNDVFTIKKTFKNKDLEFRDLYWQVQNLHNKIDLFHSTWDYVGMDVFEDDDSVTEMQIYLRKGKYIFSPLKKELDLTQPAPENVISLADRLKKNNSDTSGNQPV